MRYSRLWLTLATLCLGLTYSFQRPGDKPRSKPAKTGAQAGGKADSKKNKNDSDQVQYYKNGWMKMSATSFGGRTERLQEPEE
jgi:hypothetical protein